MSDKRRRTYGRCRTSRKDTAGAQAPLIDGHNDIAFQYTLQASGELWRMDISLASARMHTDIPRLREAELEGSSGRLTSRLPTGASSTVQSTIWQIDLIHNMNDRYPDAFKRALTADDVEDAHEGGRIGSLIGVEGGHMINNSLATLRTFYDLGRPVHDSRPLQEHRLGRLRDRHPQGERGLPTSDGRWSGR